MVIIQAPIVRMLRVCVRCCRAALLGHLISSFYDARTDCWSVASPVISIVTTPTMTNTITIVIIVIIIIIILFLALLHPQSAITS